MVESCKLCDNMLLRLPTNQTTVFKQSSHDSETHTETLNKKGLWTTEGEKGRCFHIEWGTLIPLENAVTDIWY